ncbi:hypothetical protein IWQ52_005198 [Labrenzia sp. EL_159]|nr:hypothetical protein [Labrenzia sp. EL_162]MBG6197648.1 hypothetical protein [Labrenzia sp. EL_159]
MPHEVIMPALGMAQDTGLLVGWLKQPGEAVNADDVLFEVETDKSTMEVNAGFDGFIAKLLAEAGQEVPVGETIAVISAEQPDLAAAEEESSGPIVPDKVAGNTRVEEAPGASDGLKSARLPEKAPIAFPRSEGKILASPKARRLAGEMDLDLNRLVEAGHVQPFHVKDLETLKTLPPTGTAASGPHTVRRLVAETGDDDAFADFAGWAATTGACQDQGALLAGFAALSLGRLPANVAVDRAGDRTIYAVPSTWLGQVAAAESSKPFDLHVRDLRFTRVSSVDLGAEDCPTISISRAGRGLRLTLETAGHRLTAEEAVNLLSNFAGRMEQPLRHLL